MAEQDLSQKLYKSLKGQRYLIILDDIWDIKAWDDLKQSFPDEENGSRIMFTSRINDIALQAKPDYIPVPINPLSDGESLKLLQQKLLNKDGYHPTFSQVAMQVAKNCKGLPLAIVVVAGLLQRRVEDLDWWKQIAESVGSFVAREGCMDILELSYKHLPEILKPCFLYLGVFEEDQEINAKMLIRLWIYEGFVYNSKTKNLEDVAKEYLMNLVTRSLITVSSRSSTGEIKACRIHDLLHQLCLEKGEKENFFRVLCHDGVFDYPRGFIYNHYRLCIHTKYLSFLHSDPIGPCIHSLIEYLDTLLVIDELRDFNFRKFERLQVLNLVNSCEIGGDSFEVVTSLVLLRYLAVNCRFDVVPDSIVYLVNLETISLFPSHSFLLLPRSILTSMKKLRHVDIERFCFYGDFLTDEPGESSHLEDLQTFSTLLIFPEDRPETIFRRMPRVRKLKFVFRDVPLLMLQFLSELESLNMKYVGIERLLHQHAINFPSTLKKLTLQYFFLPWSAISLISNLPNLVVLKLLDDSFVGERWDVEDEGFLKLKFLKLHHLELTRWKIESDYPFPCLEQLVIEGCRQLEGIPCNFGDIPTLKMIKVICSRPGVENSARQIQEEQLNMGNEDFELKII